jgi:hypothetical protein
MSLLPQEGETKEKSKPDSVIRAALLRRAVEDIHRLVQIRTAKQACGTLLQRGSVGDDLWQRFLRAEKEMEEEIRDVVMEVGTRRILSVFEKNRKRLMFTYVRQILSPRTGVSTSSNPHMR